MPADDHRLAFCSWSLRPKDCDDLIRLGRQTSIQRIQLALDPLASGDVGWDDARAKLRDAGFELVSGMFGAVGEDYSTIARIEETGGVMPDATWPATRSNMLAAAPIAAALGLKLVTFHAGFIPENATDPRFVKARSRLADVSAIFADHGISVALETGQESASALLAMLRALDSDDIGINFDPANMLLYGSGEPVVGLNELAPCVRQVHIKDARPSQCPGQWGSEVPVGTGSVNWRGFFDVLDRVDFAGNYVIEREAGEARIADIRTAADFVRNIRPRSSF